MRHTYARFCLLAVICAFGMSISAYSKPIYQICAQSGDLVELELPFGTSSMDWASNVDVRRVHPAAKSGLIYRVKSGRVVLDVYMESFEGELELVNVDFKNNKAIFQATAKNGRVKGIRFVVGDTMGSGTQSMVPVALGTSQGVHVRDEPGCR